MNTRAFSAIALLFAASFCAAAEYKIILEAGPRNHVNSITTVAVPDSFPSEGELRAEKLSIPFQKNKHGEITFVVPQLKENQRQVLEVRPGKTEARIQAELKEGTVRVTSGGKPVFTYQGEESRLPRPDIKPAFKRGGYIHPVSTPNGKVVTDDYPPEHIHHHGIWFPWTKTRFEGRAPDFWNMGQEKGKVEFVEFGRNWSGPVHAGLTASHRFIDLTAPSPKAALNETWELTAYHIPNADYWVFDLVSTQTCATDSPLELPKYYYGGLGFRGNRAWNGKEECHYLTSNGETDRVKGNETRGNWCHIGGLVNNEFAGIAILCHPGNFRAPQPMRLHPSEPFFCFAPSQLGDWAIVPGKPYVSRYRFIVKDGKPDQEMIGQLWSQYAHPPTARVESN